MLELMLKNFRSALRSNVALKHEIQDLICLIEQLEIQLTELIVLEEQSLFPFIRKLVQVKQLHEPTRFLQVKLLESSIRKISEEYEHAIGLLNHIRELANNYEAPKNANELLRLCYAEMEEFESDFLQHLNRERSDLFPKILELERNVMKLSSQAGAGHSSGLGFDD